MHFHVRLPNFQYARVVRQTCQLENRVKELKILKVNALSEKLINGCKNGVSKLVLNYMHQQKRVEIGSIQIALVLLVYGNENWLNYQNWLCENFQSVATKWLNYLAIMFWYSFLLCKNLMQHQNQEQVCWLILDYFYKFCKQQNWLLCQNISQKLIELICDWAQDLLISKDSLFFLYCHKTQSK